MKTPPAESRFRRLSGLITRNFGLKMLALTLAIVLYILLQPEATRTVITSSETVYKYESLGGSTGAAREQAARPAQPAAPAVLTPISQPTNHPPRRAGATPRHVQQH